MFTVPERYRARFGAGNPMNSTPADGNNGVFVIRYRKHVQLFCIASDGLGWDHVSVSVREHGKPPRRVPTWEEMCYIKRLFWTPEDIVMQYHPPESVYVNCHPFTLHLWRFQAAELPVPHPLLVGPQHG